MNNKIIHLDIEKTFNLIHNQYLYFGFSKQLVTKNFFLTSLKRSVHTNYYYYITI